MVVSTTLYRIEGNQCVGRTSNQTVECGLCHKKESRTVGTCNVCTGKERVTIVNTVRNPITKACEEKTTFQDNDCAKCEAKTWDESRCTKNEEVIITSFERMPNAACTACPVTSKTKALSSTCETNKTVSHCDTNTCKQTITTVTRAIKECGCQVADPVTKIVDCCCLPKLSHVQCVNGCNVTHTYGTGNVIDGTCKYTEQQHRKCNNVTFTAIDTYRKFKIVDCKVVQYNDDVVRECTIPCTRSSTDICTADHKIKQRIIDCVGRGPVEKFSEPKTPVCQQPDASPRQECNKETCDLKIFAKYAEVDMTTKPDCSGQDNRTVTTVYYDKDHENFVCIPKNISRVEMCKCPNATEEYIGCNNNEVKKFKVTTFMLQDGKCNPVVTENCPATEVTKQKCDSSTNDRTILTTYYEVHPTNCTCVKKEKVDRQICGKDCKPAQISTDGNKNETKLIKVLPNHTKCPDTTESRHCEKDQLKVTKHTYTCIKKTEFGVEYLDAQKNDQVSVTDVASICKSTQSRTGCENGFEKGDQPHCLW
ncbi:hypothetical protein Ciccas_006834 [Cichlidogyrus casuarinus]|uniref:Uncharacterized protein n=1 Tax=Cichlidogyrus casuarinus TaxID=1844966 RepID=A0ABD2Q5V9_9PLAT